MDIKTSKPTDITPQGSDYEIVSRVVELLTENYRDQPSLDAIASDLGQSPTQLQKTFTPLGRALSQGVPASRNPRSCQAPAAPGGIAASGNQLRARPLRPKPPA